MTEPMTLFDAQEIVADAGKRLALEGMALDLRDVSLGVDSTGDRVLQVVAVVDDAALVGTLRSAEILLAVHDAMRSAICDHVLVAWPCVHLVACSELGELQDQTCT
jgi:hypothetical protein